MTGFKRETRYTVFKGTDLAAARLTPSQKKALYNIETKVMSARADAGKRPLVCVIVERDWPEFEPTWKAIEARMTERASMQAEAVSDRQPTHREARLNAAFAKERAAEATSGADTVPMPQNADQAAMMALIGEQWLRTNAPERLRTPQPPAPVAAQGERDAELLDWLEEAPNGTIRIDDALGLAPRYIHWGGSTGLSLRYAIRCMRERSIAAQRAQEGS